jgi:hypothetical protein
MTFYFDAKNTELDILGYSLPKKYNYFYSLSSFMDRVYPGDTRKRHFKRLMFNRKYNIYDQLGDYFKIREVSKVVGYGDNEITTELVMVVDPVGLERYAIGNNEYIMSYFLDIRNKMNKLAEDIHIENNKKYTIKTD